MRKILKRIKKKPILTSCTIFFGLFFISLGCLVYSILRVANIENTLRYMVSTLLGLGFIYVLLMFIKIIFKGKNAGIIFFDILLILLFVGNSAVCATISGLYNSISNVHKDTYKYSTSLIALNENNVDIKNVKDKKIGVIDKSIDSDAYETIDIAIKENNLNTNELVKYDTNGSIIEALYKKEIDYAFVPTNYISIFGSIDEYQNISGETTTIITKEKTFKKLNIDKSKGKDEPFTMLILGMDSTISDISTVTSFNSDTLILVTFNPKTYNATILSIPRDTYVPITCMKNTESKITHSGWGSEKCVIETIENFTGINIDYYAKVNFTAVVKLVDELGGLDIEVPYSFCEQNSERNWGADTIYVKKGLQTLNGEQVLAFARNRHPNPTYCSSEWTNYYSDDIVRGENQQIIINALINKAVNNLDLSKVLSLMDIIGKNVDTNMETNDITSYYSTLKSIATKSMNSDNNVVNFEKLQLKTYGKYIYDFLLNMAGISMQIYYPGSLEDIVHEMKVNLNLEKPDIIKTFNFSINDIYKVDIIGSGDYNAKTYETVPNFVGSDISVAKTWANNNNIELDIEYVDEGIGNNNTIVSQSIPSTYRLDKINTSLKISVLNASNQENNNENINNEYEEEIEDNEVEDEEIDENIKNMLD